jgi:hypothetical protein
LFGLSGKVSGVTFVQRSEDSIIIENLRRKVGSPRALKTFGGLFLESASVAGTGNFYLSVQLPAPAQCGATGTGKMYGCRQFHNLKIVMHFTILKIK